MASSSSEKQTLAAARRALDFVVQREEVEGVQLDRARRAFDGNLVPATDEAKGRFEVQG